MVRNRDTGRFLYTERLERRPGETPWEYVRRSVRREARIRERLRRERLQVIVGWGAGSVEEFLESTPSTGPCGRPTAKPEGTQGNESAPPGASSCRSPGA